MSALVEFSRPPIEPIYSQAHPSEPIDLGRVAIQFDHNGKAYREMTKVAMRFAPEERLEFVCSLEGRSQFVAGEPPRRGLYRCGRVKLKADGWVITIAATDRTEDLTKGLEAQGGYVLTHVGRIVREDGSKFSSEQLDDLLECLHYFLSFALGRSAGVALPIGFDTEGNKVFERWGIYTTSDGACTGSHSWFDLLHGELLSQVFPGFLNLWANQAWRKLLSDAIYWYLGASDDGSGGVSVDTGLILARTALELLAWTHCVVDRKMVSQSAFKPRGLSAADKLRLLASSLNIPKQIPSHFSALQGRPGRKWVDGMDAITIVRNSLVHPDAQTEQFQSSFEGWKLSMWYIDLVLLSLCGHSGKCANRLVWRMTRYVESLPWARREDNKV
jgi:hypothetical protein